MNMAGFSTFRELRVTMVYTYINVNNIPVTDWYYDVSIYDI